MDKQKHIIWSDLEISDSFDECRAEHPDLSDDEIWGLLYEDSAHRLDDERHNLDIQLGQPIVLIAELDLWNGKKTGYKMIESGNIKDCLYSSLDSHEWYVDKNGDLRCTAVHHDGTNRYLYRVVKENVSDEQIEGLLTKIYDRTATRRDIERITNRLGDQIGAVYGWEVPSKIQKQRRRSALSDREQSVNVVDNNTAGSFPFSAYITNLGKYNEGYFIGKWHPFPTTKKEIQRTLKKIGVDGVRYEEFIVTDYECEIPCIYDSLPEYASLDELNYLASKLTEMKEWELDVFEGAVAIGGSNIQALINITENLDCYDFLSGVHDGYDLGYYWVEESGCYNTKELGSLSNYIDYERFGRDVAMDELGTFTDSGYIRATGDSFDDVYDGIHVPDEYRVFAFPPRTKSLPER